MEKDEEVLGMKDINRNKIKQGDDKETKTWINYERVPKKQ